VLVSRHRARGEAGFALVTALVATLVMLVIGLALLSIVDTQAGESGKERVRDQSFNLAESVLTSQAFVMGRSWPTVAPAGDPGCATASAVFGDTLGNTAAAPVPVTRLRPNLNASYTDAAYAGATWQVATCDDVPGEEVWNPAVTTRKSWDANGNNRVWVRAQATVAGKTRTVVGIVQVRRTKVLDSRFGAVAGGMADDLGATVSGITDQGVLGSVLGTLLNTTPTVAADPSVPASTPSGVTGVRCGVLNLGAASPTCISGTIAAVGAVPLVGALVTGGRLEHVPGTSTASLDGVSQLRQQARTAVPSTYVATSPGTAPTGSGSLLNPSNRAPASAAPCAIPAAAGPGSVVFIEKVGGGDDYCSVDVSVVKQYKALVVGSGRVIIRGNGQTTASTNLGTNTFRGIVYALNLQTTPVADGGLGLSDAASAAREVLRVDNGAHVRGGVYADGNSARIGIYPPPLSVDQNALINSIYGCDPFPILTCTTLKALNGIGNLVGGLLDALGLGAVNRLVDGLTGQLNPQRVSYGSAVTADVAAIDAVTMFGPSGLVPGTFRDLASGV
jgi:Tfp pilus assembly protein PilV